MTEQSSFDSSRKLNTVTRILIFGFTLSVIFHYVLGNYLGYDHHYYYTTFLFDPRDRFNDFFNIYRATVNLDPYAAPVSVYFPFTFILMYLFTFLREQYSFFVFMSLFGSYFIWYIYRNISLVNAPDRLLSVFVFTCMSYPVLFNFDRGNVEVFVFIFLTLFLFFYQKDQHLLGVLFLSLAISMKLYPGVFVILYLVDRNYRNIFATVSMTAVVSLSSAALLQGGILTSLAGIQRNLAGFGKFYLVSSAGLQHNSSLYGVIRIIGKNVPPIMVVLEYYSIIVMGFFVLMVIYILVKEDILWRKAALLTFSMVLFPQVSFDYKLIHVFIPLMLFINTGHSSRFDRTFSIMFALLLIPKDYIQFGHAVSIAVILNPILMLGVMAIILFERFEQSRL